MNDTPRSAAAERESPQIVRAEGPAPSQPVDPDRIAAPTPRVLWIELTSKCPLDCVFCSRRTVRGDGEHLDFDLYRRLLAELDRPEIIRLNYSGESAHYPHLRDAIALARQRGAFVELVTALATASESTVRDLVTAGLDRLTISLHALSPERFRAIYRVSSVESMRARIALLRRIQQELGTDQPRLDFAFVAMADNLAELAGVAAYAQSVGVSEVAIHPLLRRDDIPLAFEREQHDNRLHAAFKRDLGAAIAAAQAATPGVQIVVSSPVLADEQCLGDVPRPWPGDLPAGARVHSCDQNPWDTVHVLSDGSVVVCEVLDREPLGSLRDGSLAAIWHGAAYRDFRRRFVAGAVAACQTCPWKHVHRPAPLRRQIGAPFAVDAAAVGQEFVRGWYPPEPTTVWSKPDAVVVLGNVPVARWLHLAGTLPGAADGNELLVACDGIEIGRVAGDGPHARELALRLRLPASSAPQRTFTFRLRHGTCPLRAGTGSDGRMLGFALRALRLQ